MKNERNNYYNYLIDKSKINPNHLSLASGKQNLKNGQKINCKIYLNFLSIEDGKRKFVELTKEISKNVACNNISISDINEQYINNELFKLCGLPDPELVVISGTIYSSFGLLPWHIRVTEFL